MWDISVDDSLMKASVEDLHSLSIRLIAQDYPKYQSVIPEQTSFVLRTDKGLLVDAVKRIKIMSNEQYDGVKIKLKDSEMILASQNPALGEADEKLEVEYTGKEMDICFNARYLMDALTTLEEGKVSMGLNNQFSPVIFKSEKLPGHLGVVMPLKR